MMPFVAALLKPVPRSCSGSALLILRSSLQPVPGCSQLWASCSSTNRSVVIVVLLLDLNWQYSALTYSCFIAMLTFFPFCIQATEQAKEEMKRVLAVLNQHLNTRTFLVGERVSLADITVVCSLLWLYKQVSIMKTIFLLDYLWLLCTMDLQFFHSMFIVSGCLQVAPVHGLIMIGGSWWFHWFGVQMALKHET